MVLDLERDHLRQIAVAREIDRGRRGMRDLLEQPVSGNVGKAGRLGGSCRGARRRLRRTLQLGRPSRPEQRLERGGQLRHIDRMNGPVVGRTRFHGAGRRIARCHGARTPGPASTGARAWSLDTTATGSDPALLHELARSRAPRDKNATARRTDFRVPRSTRSRPRASGRRDARGREAQPQFEIVMNHQTQLGRAGRRRFQVRVSFGRNVRDRDICRRGHGSRP